MFTRIVERGLSPTGEWAAAFQGARAPFEQPMTARIGSTRSPQEQAVLAAMEAYKQAVIAGDTVALKRIWADTYTFINAQGVLVTRAQRLANFASGATNVAVIDNEREITVRVYGDNAVVQNLSTLRGQFSGQPTDTDLRGTFVWIHRQVRRQLVTNQLTSVVR
jgi:ketosteroid isomerase-like protein